MPTGNAQNGFSDDALAAALEAGTAAGLRIINAGRQGDGKTPQALHGVPDGPSKQ